MPLPFERRQRTSGWHTGERLMEPEVPEFSHVVLPDDWDVVAPDGSFVRALALLPAGSMAHFELGPGQVSRPRAHHSVSEIWYVVSGRGVMWRRRGPRQSELDMHPGVSLTIPVGTSFQFRSTGPDPLAAIGVTMPLWPGDQEAFEVEGPWRATL